MERLQLHGVGKGRIAGLLLGMTDQGLDYIPGLIAAFRSGYASDHVHLGYWPDRAALSWEAAQTAMTQLHTEMLDLRDGMTIADIGCGIGGSIRMLNARLRDSTLLGINIDPRQLEVCSEQKPLNGNSLKWVKADASATTLADESVDRVLSVEAMFHFPSRALFLTEAMRILRPEGVLVCSDIMLKPPRSEAERACLSLVLRSYAPWPHPTAIVADHAALAERTGFIQIKTSDISAQVDPTWDHIVSSKETPLSSPQAAMRALQRAGQMSYVISTMRKSATHKRAP